MVAGDEVARRHFLPFRHGVLADFGAVRAARVEFAALRRVDRAGDIAFQNPQLAVLLHVRGRNRGHQRLGVRVQRVIKQLLRVRQFDHVAQIHDADSVGNVLDNGKIVRDEQIGQVALFLQIGQQVDNLALDGHVQRGNRLVTDDELRLHRQTAGNADALALAAGELVREAMQEVARQTRVLHRLDDVFLHALVVLLEEAVRQQTLADDVADGHARVQAGIRILEDELQVAAELADLVVFQSREVDALVAQRLVVREFRVARVLRALSVQLTADVANLARKVGELLVDLRQLGAQLGLFILEAAGVLSGLIGILPGIILFIAMCGFYPTIIEQELPVDYILTQMNMPWLRYIFQIVLFGTLIETGSGLIYSITDRIAEAFKNKGQEVPKWSTPVVAVILLVGTTAISSFGLTGLIAKGYGTLAWVMFIVYVIPILTLGIYKISKAKKN